GLVEIWNGMPFFSPFWARRPTVTWLHHVHDTMWDMTLTPRLARLGRRVEFDVAPLVYRRTPIVTLSSSSKQELVQKLHLAPERTGLLVDDPAQLGPAIARVLGDNALRAALASEALEHASRFTWAATACGTLEVLANEALRRRRS